MTRSSKQIEEFWREVDAMEQGASVGPPKFTIPWPVRTVEQIDADNKTYHGPLKPKAVPEHIGSVEAPPRDNVNLPHHYARYKIEPIQFLMENRVDAFQFNIIKYVLRHDAKNGLEDIRKVLRYGEMYLKYLSGDPDWWKPSTMTIGGYE